MTLATVMSDGPEQDDREWFLRLVNLAQDGSPASVWAPAELEAVWSHQLDASVTKCIEEMSLVHALHCQTLCSRAAPAITSLRDLFTRPDPDVQLLTMVARWVERGLGDPQELIPRDISLSLFNIAIVLARLRCATRLINGTDAELARRADWVASRPWMDRITAEAMRRASQELGGVDSSQEANG